MRLQTLGNNQTLVHVGGQEYFFSYNTCVAGRDDCGEFWKVDYRISNTTTRHINSYLDGINDAHVRRVSYDDATLALDCV